MTRMPFHSFWNKSCGIGQSPSPSLPLSPSSSSLLHFFVWLSCDGSFAQNSSFSIDHRNKAGMGYHLFHCLLCSNLLLYLGLCNLRNLQNIFCATTLLPLLHSSEGALYDMDCLFWLTSLFLLSLWSAIRQRPLNNQKSIKGRNLQSKEPTFIGVPYIVMLGRVHLMGGLYPLTANL